MKTFTQILLPLLLLCIAPVALAQGPCEPVGAVEFVCGPQNAEDLVSIPDSPWIIASGMAAGSGFYSVDTRSDAWQPIPTTVAHDASLYPLCSSPPPVGEFQSHGLNIREHGEGETRLYVVGHGAREAIEVYSVGMSGGRPSLTWNGCVRLPEEFAANSVASFEDGSLVATILLLPGRTFADSVAMRPTGVVVKWTPGDAGFETIEGTELPGNNGIEVSEDGSEIFVVSSGFQKVVAYSNTNPARELRSTEQLPITPDNVHMGPNGQLLTAGMKNDVPACGGPPGPDHDLAALSTCPRGAIGIAIDPQTMQERILFETPAMDEFSNATMVLPAGGRYWLGTFSGNRIASVEAD